MSTVSPTEEVRERKGPFYTFFVDGEEFHVDEPTITGQEIMELVGIPLEVGLILLLDDGTQRPLLGSYALCTPCVTTFPYWPDAWTQPTPRACRCGACQAPVLQASLRGHQAQDRSLDGPRSERGIER